MGRYRKCLNSLSKLQWALVWVAHCDSLNSWDLASFEGNIQSQDKTSPVCLKIVGWIVCVVVLDWVVRII